MTESSSDWWNFRKCLRKLEGVENETLPSGHKGHNNRFLSESMAHVFLGGWAAANDAETLVSSSLSGWIRFICLRRLKGVEKETLDTLHTGQKNRFSLFFLHVESIAAAAEWSSEWTLCMCLLKLNGEEKVTWHSRHVRSNNLWSEKSEGGVSFRVVGLTDRTASLTSKMSSLPSWNLFVCLLKLNGVENQTPHAAHIWKNFENAFWKKIWR